MGGVVLVLVAAFHLAGTVAYYFEPELVCRFVQKAAQHSAVTGAYRFAGTVANHFERVALKVAYHSAVTVACRLACVPVAGLVLAASKAVELFLSSCLDRILK